MADNQESIENTVREDKILKPMNNQSSSPHTKIAPLVLIVAIALGIATGWFFSRGGSSLAKITGVGGGNKSAAEMMQGSGNATVVGSTDTSTFKDCTKGKLISNDGKITNEGTHILQRSGGDSQNVYLTSSVVDLSQFLNKTIEVCGQTNQGQKAGWLLDVGIVKVE